MKVVQNTPKMVRFDSLKPGDAFDACGDVAVKAVDGKAVVLKDGNYVHREPGDFVYPVDAVVHL